jgi:hypothetical protein
MPEKRNYTGSYIITAYTFYKIFNPTPIPGKTKADLRSKGKDKRQTASRSTPICP